MGQQHVYNYKITNASAQGISLYLLFTNILAIYAHGAAWLSYGAAWLSYGAAWLS